MKFSVLQSDFSRALLSASKSITARANLPILANVLLVAGKNKLSILATDLETACQTTANCKVGTEGRATVPGKVLLEFIAQIPEGEIIVEKLGEEIVVWARGYSARFATMAVEDFPAIPKIEHGYVLKIGSGDLVSAISKVAFCAAVDEGRPVLTGILCEVGKSAIVMVATDGYRLSYQKVPLVGVTGGNLPVRVIIPARAMIEVSKLIGEASFDESGEIQMTIAEGLNQLNIKIGDVEFTTRLIEGSFPPWQKIIPDKFTSQVKVSRGELMRLIKITSIFARDSGNIIKLTIGPKDASSVNTLKVFAGNKQVGSNEAEMEVELTGRGGEIAFNFRYLLEMLSSVDAEDVIFEMIESLNPGKLTVGGDSDYFYIVMPVRLQN